MLLLLLLLTETTASETKTTKAMDIKINIPGNIDGKVELNQNILSANRLLIRAYHEYFWNSLLYQEKSLEHYEWDIQLTKRQRAPTTAAITVTLTSGLPQVCRHENRDLGTFRNQKRDF